MYFVHDPNGYGFQLYDSEDDAKEMAEEILAMERDDALNEGEWSDDISYVCWGKVIEKAITLDIDEPLDEDGTLYIDYDLRKV